MAIITPAFINHIRTTYIYDKGRLWRDGTPAGWLDRTGYYKLKIRGHSFLLHRAIWLYFNDTIPDMIDHINMNKLDNNIENLRGVPSRAFNTVNSVPRSDNTSGYKGVTWHKNVGKWHCSIFKDGKRHYLGIYDDPKEAAKKYNEMAVELFGDFAHLNEIH